MIVMNYGPTRENILVIYNIIKSQYFSFIKAYWKMLKSQMGYWKE